MLVTYFSLYQNHPKNITQVGAKGENCKLRKGIFGQRRRKRRRGKKEKSRRRSAWESETERRREIERKLILGSRDALKTQRFRLGFLLFFFFPPLLRAAVSRQCPIIEKREGHACSCVPYAYDTGTAGKLPCQLWNRTKNSSKTEPTDQKCDPHKATTLFIFPA